MNELLIVKKLRHYAAIEAFAGDTDATVIRALLEAIEVSGSACLGVEVLGKHSIGSVNFVRLRLDVPYQPHWLPDRGYIIASLGVFRAHLRDGRAGKVTMSAMLASQPNRRIYHGTSEANWRLQFV